MTNPPRPTLPSEIQSRIISNLHDDGPTLLTCSLACWAWYDHAISTFWLSRPLKIGSAYSKGLPKAARLRHLLEGPTNQRHCRFACYVKLLELNGPSLQRPSPQQEKSAYVNINNDIRHLMQYSPHLTDISINWVNIIQLESVTLNLLSVTNIHSLTFHGVNFDVPNSLLSLLSKYKDLGECSIINCRIASWDPLTQFHSTSTGFEPLLESASLPESHHLEVQLEHSSLRRLVIYLNRGFEVVLKQLLLQPSHVAHLSVTWPIPYEFPLVAQVLKHTGRNLETLAIDLGDAVEMGQCEDFENFPIKLFSNVSLRTLELKTIRIPEDEAYSSTWLHTLLSSINSPLFETLTLEFSPVNVSGGSSDGSDAIQRDSEEYFFENFDWIMLDEVLSSNKYFDSWRIVQIEVCDADYHLNNDSNDGAIEAEFRSRLPIVDTARKLAVDF